jgi:hypothetical protein
MTTIFSDLARERFASELAAADADRLRGLAYSYLGLASLDRDRTSSTWRWKVEMIRDECHRRGRADLFDGEQATVDHERARPVCDTA